MTNGILIVFTSVIILGCQHKIVKQTNNTPKGATAESVIAKVKSNIVSVELDKKIKTVEYKCTISKVHTKNNLKINLNTKYYYEKPDNYKFIAKTTTDTLSGGHEIKTLEYTKFGDKIRVLINGEKPDHLESTKSKINVLKDDVHNAKIQLSLGIYQDFLTEKLYKKFSLIQGVKCYKIKVTLDKKMRSKRDNELMYYIDSEKFLIKKITGKSFVVRDIKYRKIDGMMIPEKYTEIEDLHFDKVTSYYRLDKYKLNQKINKDFFAVKEKVPGKKL